MSNDFFSQDDDHEIFLEHKEFFDKFLKNLGIRRHRKLANLLYDNPEDMSQDDLMFFVDRMQDLTVHASMLIIKESLRRLLTHSNPQPNSRTQNETQLN